MYVPLEGGRGEGGEGRPGDGGAGEVGLVVGDGVRCGWGVGESRSSGVGVDWSNVEEGVALDPDGWGSERL